MLNAVSCSPTYTTSDQPNVLTRNFISPYHVVVSVWKDCFVNPNQRFVCKSMFKSHYWGGQALIPVYRDKEHILNTELSDSIKKAALILPVLLLLFFWAKQKSIFMYFSLSLQQQITTALTAFISIFFYSLKLQYDDENTETAKRTRLSSVIR